MPRKAIAVEPTDCTKMLLVLAVCMVLLIGAWCAADCCDDAGGGEATPTATRELGKTPINTPTPEPTITVTPNDAETPIGLK